MEEEERDGQEERQSGSFLPAPLIRPCCVKRPLAIYSFFSWQTVGLFPAGLLRTSLHILFWMCREVSKGHVYTAMSTLGFRGQCQEASRGSNSHSHAVGESFSHSTPLPIFVFVFSHFLFPFCWRAWCHPTEVSIFISVTSSDVDQRFHL